MSIYASGTVAGWESIPYRLRGLAHVIADAHDPESGRCSSDLSYLAKYGGCSVSTVQRMLRELENRKLISIERGASNGEISVRFFEEDKT